MSEQAENVPHGTNLTNNEAPMEEHWFIDEGIKGEGKRPDWLMNNFPNMKAQAMAYPEARKALGAKSGAPDDYDFGELKDQVDIENPHLSEFKKICKEAKIDQDFFSKAVKTFVDYDSHYVPNLDAELEKLGPEGKKIYEVNEQFIKNKLSPKAQETYNQLPKYKEVIEFVDEMRQKFMNSMDTIPNNPAHTTNERLTKESVSAEIQANGKRYMDDPAYRAEMKRKMAIVYGEL